MSVFTDLCGRAHCAEAPLSRGTNGFSYCFICNKNKKGNRLRRIIESIRYAPLGTLSVISLDPFVNCGQFDSFEQSIFVRAVASQTAPAMPEHVPAAGSPKQLCSVVGNDAVVVCQHACKRTPASLQNIATCIQNEQGIGSQPVKPVDLAGAGLLSPALYT